jgi:hypothetical protein
MSRLRYHLLLPMLSRAFRSLYSIQKLAVLKAKDLLESLIPSQGKRAHQQGSYVQKSEHLGMPDILLSQSNVSLYTSPSLGNQFVNCSYLDIVPSPSYTSAHWVIAHWVIAHWVIAYFAAWASFSLPGQV